MNSAAFDPTKIASKKVCKRPGKFLGLAADPDAQRLFAGSTDYHIHVYDLKAESKEPCASWLGHENYVSALVLAARPSGPQIISGSYDSHLLWWDTKSGEVVRDVQAHAGWIRDLTILPESGLVASCGDDMRIKLWDIETGQLVRTFEGHAKRTPQGHVTALYVLAASPDGKYLASGDRIGQVHVWDVQTGQQAASFQVPVLYTYDDRQRKRSIGGIRSLAFSPDGQWIAVGGIGQIGNVDGLQGPATIELWNWQVPKRLFATGAEGHKAILNQLQFWPDGGWIVGVGGGGDNGLLCVWKAEPPADAARSEAVADAARKEAPAENQDKNKEDKKEDSVPVHKIKAEGHLHRLVLNPAAGEIYTAGHEKLEVWHLPR